MNNNDKGLPVVFGLIVALTLLLSIVAGPVGWTPPTAGSAVPHATPIAASDDLPGLKRKAGVTR